MVARAAGGRRATVSGPGGATRPPEPDRDAAATTTPATESRIVVVGAGPAGLTAAYELTRFNVRPIVLEKSGAVGGLARTETYKGFRFDLGGHRFFSKVDEVNKLWHEVLGAEFIRRPRLSRIYYERTFFFYPLRPLNALRGLGLWRSVRIVLSYVRWRLLPYRQEDTFEHWVTNRFGRRLFLTFFKSYTEKVWGIPCSELKAEWAAQRIKDLSLRTVLLQMYRKPKRAIKTLIEEFYYPRLGPGMMWETVQERIESRGGAVRLHADVVEVRRADARVESVVVARAHGTDVVPTDELISSMPISELVLKLDPPAPPPVVAAARCLRYRDFLTVCLIVKQADVFPDNWIYIHDPEVRVGRIQNFKNWSPAMVPDATRSCLGLEYFCTEGDDLWESADDALIALGTRELERVGLVVAADVEDGCVVRVPKSYPIYDSGYTDALATIRAYLATFDNLHTIGRNGLHRYNNQDHSMMTGVHAARNVALGQHNDVWSVNVDQEYHEEIDGDLPPDDVTDVVEATLARVFNKLDTVALGIATGAVAGGALALATLALWLTGPSELVRYLSLLGQYFPGYRVSGPGSALGLVYGGAAGFAAGCSFAWARNAAMALYLTVAYGRAERTFLRRLFDFM
jgi:protoporphyrinogen oxidase